MIDLGVAEFYIAVPSLPKNDFEKYSMQLFDQWESFVENTVTLPDYSLALQVEEGSIKGAGQLAATAFALYIGIGNYGSFVSGLEKIRTQLSSVGSFLANRADDPFASEGIKARVTK